jgi:hypothetical protein
MPFSIAATAFVHAAMFAFDSVDSSSNAPFSFSRCAVADSIAAFASARSALCLSRSALFCASEPTASLIEASIWGISSSRAVMPSASFLLFVSQ